MRFIIEHENLDGLTHQVPSPPSIAFLPALNLRRGGGIGATE